jgi:hypothetical protein
MKNVFLTLLLIYSLTSHTQEKKATSDHLSVLTKTGQEPIKFVTDLLNDFDLIVFDDALHIAKEPFDFYQSLVKNKRFVSKIKYVFVEVFSITSQPHIDSYLNSPTKDKAFLLPVFQNDFSGYGLRSKTYLDLLSTIWDVNVQLSEPEKIQVICVDQPIYWDSIKTRKDYDLFQKSLLGRDYFMYKVISKTLSKFKKAEKGIFLTNTRHAYKNIKNSNGELYWNTGTFLNQWHPKKTYSIRLHNVILSIQSTIDSTANSSTEGLDKISYEWIKIDDGLWDKAFQENGNQPVAISLENNIFGNSPYVGNHMLNVSDNQTMNDAYDGLIFLAPLEKLHFSAKVDFIYTEPFIQELKRRILLLQGNQLPDFLFKNDAASLDGFISELIKYQEPRTNHLVPKDSK